MKRESLSLAVSIVLTALGVSCAARSARAASPSSGPEIRLDIADSGQRPVRVAVAVPTDGGCSKVEASAGREQYKFQVCRGHSGHGFDFDIRCENPRREVRVSVSARLEQSRPALLADLRRADGSTTRISAEID